VFIFWEFGAKTLVLCLSSFLWGRFSIPLNPLHCLC
jgi:hypothetical protein